VVPEPLGHASKSTAQNRAVVTVVRLCTVIRIADHAFDEWTLECEGGEVADSGVTRPLSTAENCLHCALLML